MLFNSAEFGLLLAVTLPLYFLVKNAAWQLAVLIAASLVFYAHHSPELTLLLLFTQTVAATASFALAQPRIKRRLLLCLSAVGVSLSVLAFFKYGGLLVQTMMGNAEKGSLAHSIIMLPLPIGISFYTFHAISLIVDAFRNSRTLELEPNQGARHFLRHYFYTAFYMLFFPQLIAGPIMRAKDFYPQIRLKLFRHIHFQNAVKALITGYFLKVFIADNLAQVTVAMGYEHQWMQLPGRQLFWMMLGYTLQIYADFAGYSLIAIGLARLFGYELMQNFNAPYIATSFAGFWRRWHISLSTWLRDYLYVPLGGNRHGSARTYINIAIVMLLGGLWHGAAWKYLAWGVWHGFWLIIERMVKPYLPPLGVIGRIIGWVFVMAAVSIGWLFFALSDISHIIPYLSAIPSWDTKLVPGVTSTVLRQMVMLMLALVILHHLLVATKLGAHRIIRALEPCALGLMLAVTITAAGPQTAFIYFQF